MSLLRAVLILGAAIMLLPVDEKRQAAFSVTATKAASEAATFCERNVHTCGAGRELWSLFLHKAEYGMELGARIIRDHVLRAGSSDQASLPRPSTPSSPAAFRYDQPPSQRSGYLMDNPSRWR